MKTCNGCYFLHFKPRYSGEWWCRLGKSRKIYSLPVYDEPSRDIPTPEWCKKEVKDENL